MSYRAFKRLLGETSLERKCRALLGTFSLVLITGSCLLYARLTERIAYEATANSGRLLVPLILNSLHINRTEYRDAMDEHQHHVESQWPKALQLYQYKLLKLKPRKPADQPEPEESALVQNFANDPKSQEDSRTTGGDFAYYYGPIRAVRSCLVCHPRHPEETEEYGSLREGDLMAVVRVKLSSQAIEEGVHLNRAILLSIALSTSILIMAGSWLIVRYVIVKPLKHLKQVSDAIATGEVNVRSEIQTGDEFEDLSDAFNRMLRNLMSSQEQLKLINVDLDRKVDALARANMALYESNRLKSDFLATMSHELRTPLNSILGFSELMLANPQLPDKLRRWAGNIQTSGKQLLALINDLLDLAKIEAGKMEVRPEAFALDEVFEGQAAMFRPLAEKKNIDLNVQLAADLQPVYQDIGKLRQILGNLTSNAIKFTPEGGRVTLRAQSDGDWFQLVVNDTGVGIAPDDQEAVFDKFRQAANPMTRDYGGTGLGLSIVRELAKLLGGDVTLQSEVGRGSTFVVRLPRHLRDAPRVVYEPQAVLDGPDPTPVATPA